MDIKNLRTSSFLKFITFQESESVHLEGKMVPSQAPKPMRIPSRSQKPEIRTESPSLINFLSSSPTFTVLVPFQLNSSIDPYSPCSGPEIVPEPYKSPGWELQPFAV